MLRKLIDRYRLYVVIPAVLFLAVPAVSQNPKGVITGSTQPAVTGKTRALIIGISKYQFIDSLQFADTDAEVFAEYLRSNSFWSLEKDDITLLTNEKAKYGDLTIHLQQLALQSKPGDNLLFYFSGHGDVETNTLFNRGFLLAHDTYSSNYMANGLRVDDLKDLFVTLLTNNVKVIVVTDACRSGKLAGGMKGAEFTATAISSIWKNEIKILSSQPGQLSYEDRKWGNGRGVFSYYLIKGMDGEADANKDSLITLAELEMYVGSNVAKETDNQQQPIFEGPNKYSTIIARVGRPAHTEKSRPGGNTAGPFYRRVVLPFDSCDYYYQQMTAAIDGNKLASGVKGSAGYFYQQLKNCSRDSNFVLSANVKLLSALMNSTQEIVNNSFIGKNLVSGEKFNEGIDMIGQLFRYSELKLLNPAHWKNLQRYLHVQGEALWNDNTDPAILENIIDTALREEPDGAYLLTARAAVEMKKKNWDNAIRMLESSLEKSPTWLIPKYYLGICYANRRNYKKALEYYEQVLQKDSSYRTFECTKCILLKMAEYSFKSKQFKRGLDYLFRNIDLFPDHWAPYELLYEYAVEKKDTLVAKDFLSRLERFTDTVSMQLLRLRFENEFYGTSLSPGLLATLTPRLKNNTDSADYFYTLGLYYNDKKSKDTDSALICFTRAAELDPEEGFYLYKLSELMSEEGMHEELQELLNLRIPSFKDEEKASLQELLANSYLDSENYQEAFDVCKELVAAGYMTCGDLRKMKKAFRDLREYESFIKSCKDDK